jgi:inorganic pyrophosphatase
MNDKEFWQAPEALFTNNKVTIDRPKGARHPHYAELCLPLDYGYIQDTRAGDGDSIDLWFGSQIERVLTGILCMYDINKHDAEIKLLIGCSASDIEVIRTFYAGGMRLLFIPNPFLRR